MYFSPKEIKKFTNQLIKDKLDNSDDTYEVDLGIKKFIEFIKTGKIEIKVYPYDKIPCKSLYNRKRYGEI